MAVTIVRPATLGTDDFGNGVGAGTHIVRVQDNLDTTSVRSAGTAPFNRLWVSASTAYFNAGNTYIRRVRAAVRYSTNVATADSAMKLNLGSPFAVGTSQVDWNGSDITLFPSTTIVTAYGPWVTEAQAAAQEQQGWYLLFASFSTSAAQPKATITSYPVPNNAFTTQWDIYDIWFEIEGNDWPTATVTAPTGTIYPGVSGPKVTFTYSDLAAESDPMLQYQIKIFSAAQYGAGGFSPDTSASTWDSGIVQQYAAAGSSLSIQTTANLVSGTTYKAYVLVWQTVDSRVSSSGWAIGPTFVESILAPAQPTLTATADDANRRITLAFQGRDNILSRNNSSFETSVAGWANIANATLSRVTTQFLDGIAAMQLSSIAAGNMSAIAPTGTSGCPVIVGATYTALASFKSAASVRSCRVDINWYNAAGASIGGTAGTAGNDATGAWTQLSNTAVAPANAAFAAVSVVVLATGGAAELHWVDQVDIGPGSSTAWTSGGLIVNAYFEKSVDGGTTWTAVRGGSAIGVTANDAPDNSQIVTIYDYEALPAQSTQYRARGVQELAGSVSFGTADTGAVYSPYSATATATSNPSTGSPATGWLMKDPLDPTQNQAIDLRMDSFDTDIKEEQAVYMPIGRSKPIVVADVVRGEDGTLKVECDSLAKATAWEAIRNKQHTLLLQRVYTDPKNWYIRLGADMKKTVTNTTPPLYRYEIQYVEVDAP